MAIHFTYQGETIGSHQDVVKGSRCMDELISNSNGALFDADFQSLAGLALDSAQDEILWTDAQGRLIMLTGVPARRSNPRGKSCRP